MASDRSLVNRMLNPNHVAFWGLLASVVTVIAAVIAVIHFVWPNSVPVQPSTHQSPSAGSVSTSATSPGTGSSSGGVTPSAGTVANGTQLGAYSFAIVAGYSVPISDTAPGQGQFVPGNGSGDLYSDPNYGALVAVGVTNRLLALPGNIPPSYASCTASTAFTGRVSIVTGTTFCLWENSRMVGGKITGTGSHFGDPTKIDVTSWQDNPDPAPATGAAVAPNDQKPDGTQRGAYSFGIVSGYSAPLGDTAPTQQQFVPGNGAGDLYFDPNYGSFVAVGAVNKLVSLTGNPTPTYAACKASTAFAGRVAIVKGVTFCLSENGRMVGLTITATGQYGAPVTIGVVVWQNSPT